MKNGSRAPARALVRRICMARGFTLIEAMVVIVLMAVLSALAMPSFQGLIERYRVERVATAMAAGVSYARSEAVRRGRTVKIVAGSGCNGTNWSCGWLATTENANESEVLKQQDPDASVVITKSAAGDLSFDATGHSSNAVSFAIAPAGTTDSPNVAVVCMSRGGRIKVITGAATCTSS